MRAAAASLREGKEPRKSPQKRRTNCGERWPVNSREMAKRASDIARRGAGLVFMIGAGGEVRRWWALGGFAGVRPFAQIGNFGAGIGLFGEPTVRFAFRADGSNEHSGDANGGVAARIDKADRAFASRI